MSNSVLILHDCIEYFFIVKYWLDASLLWKIIICPLRITYKPSNLGYISPESKNNFLYIYIDNEIIIVLLMR